MDIEHYEEYKDYFGRENITNIHFNYPVKKSQQLTHMRKIGDYVGQYVTSIRYLDDIYGDASEVFRNSNGWDLFDDDVLVYSYYDGDDCDHCKEHLNNVKKNLIVGVKIYPKNIVPIKYTERKKKWDEFR